MFAVDPLITLLFSEAQLRLANKIIGDDKFVLHLDATGSLLKQKDNEKRIFLYSLVYPMKKKTSHAFLYVNGSQMSTQQKTAPTFCKGFF